jgi:cation transporter-like permease
VTTWTDADASGGAQPSGEHGLAHGVHVADRRGLTAAGAVAVALVLGALGGFVDVMTGSGLRTVFAVCFIAGCAIAALKVHREDLFAAVVMPPLVYLVIALLAGAFSKTAAVGGVLTRQALELATSLVLGAPVLLTATGLAFLIALARAVVGRGTGQPRTAEGD